MCITFINLFVLPLLVKNHILPLLTIKTKFAICAFFGFY